MTSKVNQIFMNVLFQLLLIYHVYLYPVLKFVWSSSLPFKIYRTRSQIDILDSVKLTKIPVHLAVSLGKLTIFDGVDIKNVEMSSNILDKLVDITYWASLLDVKFISFYDQEGFLKQQVQVILQHLTKKFYECSLENGNQIICRKHKCNEANITVFIRSREDGKELLLQAIQDIYFSNQTNPISVAPITAKLIDHHLNQKMYGNLHSNVANVEHLTLQTDPDLMMTLGNNTSLMGFLPWHIRNTEIHILPSILDLKYADFVTSIRKFANCEQRFGK